MRKFIAFIAFLQLPTMTTFSNVSAGQVHLNSNNNAKITGERNQGTISGNSNLKLEATNSALNLQDNNNAKVIITDTNLNSISCSNLKLSGNGNTAQLRNNSNGAFDGDGNKWEAFSNSNVKVRGNRCVVNLQNNLNVKMEGDQGVVTAADNSNLRVLGEGNRVEVKGTVNHELKLASKENGLVNQLDFIPIPGESAGWFATAIAYLGPTRRCRYKVDYVDQAVINGGQYNLGIYNFKVKADAMGNQHDITVDQTGLDPGSLVSQVVGGNEVRISATKNGIKQTLKLTGPQVVEADGAGKVFKVSML